MHTHKRKKISIESIIAWVLSLGVMVSLGLLSFCGMIAIYPSIALAGLAFALSGIVEGEVFRQNIFKGIRELKLLFSRKLSSVQRRALFLSVLLSIAGGIGFGFATASSLEATALLVGTFILPTIWPLAIIASIGYALLAYHTFADIIQNETLAKWKTNLDKWFHKNPSRFRAATNGLLLTLAIVLSIAATAATFGTWWVAVKSGAELLPRLAPLAKGIRDFFVPIASFTTLIFNLRNSFISVENMIASLDKATLPNPINIVKNAFHYLTARKNDETLNPFRVLEKLVTAPYIALVFVGHLIAMGLVAVRTPGYERLSLIFTTLSEFFTDLHYFFSSKEHAHAHGHAHHDHSNTIPMLFLDLVLFPVRKLATGWDMLFNKAVRTHTSTTGSISPRLHSHSDEEEHEHHEHHHCHHHKTPANHSHAFFAHAHKRPDSQDYRTAKRAVVGLRA